jgi:hypothetical protein
MPQIIPFIPLIIAGVGTGVSTFEALNQPGAPKPQAQEAPKPPDQTQEKEQLAAAAPSVQERLGGAVAPDFFASEVARVSGNPQDTELAKQVLSQFLGLGGTPDKMGASEGTVGQGATGGQNFSPFTATGPTPGAGQPNFFEGLLGGGGSGGDGMNEFSGGTA